ETFGRKVFAHEAVAGHCHASGGIYYSLYEASCDGWGGDWDAASTKPFINNASIKNKTSTSFEVDVTASEASMVYAVLLLTSATTPTSAQVIAGTDGGGGAAVRAVNTAVSNTGTFSFTGLESSR